MAKVDKKFDYLGLIDRAVYNHLDKATNVRNNVVYMLDRSNVMFKYHNLPDSIPASEIEKILQTSGFAVVGKSTVNFMLLMLGLEVKPMFITVLLRLLFQFLISITMLLGTLAKTALLLRMILPLLA